MRTRKRFHPAPWLVPLVFLFGGCPEKKEPAALQAEATHAPKPQATQDTLPGSWEADVRSNLMQMIGTYGQEAEKYDPADPPVVVFDFDNTCIRGDIGRAFFDRMIIERKIRFNPEVWEALPRDKRKGIQEAWKALSSLPADQQAGSDALQKFRKLMHRAYWSLCFETPPEKCYPWQVRFYAGYTPEDLLRMAAEVIEHELSRPMGSEEILAGPEDPAPTITSTGIRINQEIQQLILLLRTKGFSVWIVTAGPQWVVQASAKYFGLDPGQVIGMRTVLSEGKLTSQIDPPPTFKEGKVKAIEKFIGKKPVLAVGDSWTDAEMLAYAQHALLIDRGYADLKKKALEAEWWIQPAFPVK